MLLREAEFKDRCIKRGLSDADVESAIKAVENLAGELCGKTDELESIPLAKIETYIERRKARSEVDAALLMAFARYFAVLERDEVAIRLLAYLLPVGVLPSMADRLEALEGTVVRDKVMDRFAVPPVGSKPEEYPAAAAAFTQCLEEELGTSGARHVLAWNVHGIPAQAWESERQEFLKAESLESWLAGLHERRVAEIHKHAKDGTLWFEQKITMRVVEYVRGNQEILSGVSDGSYIYATKIPYNPDGFLGAATDLERRKFACHCPFAAASITEKGALTPPLWCYCSAGYEKFIFDTVFGAETNVEVLESVLAGDLRCRFKIEIPETVKKRFWT